MEHTQKGLKVLVFCNPFLRSHPLVRLPRRLREKLRCRRDGRRMLMGVIQLNKDAEDDDEENQPTSCLSHPLYLLLQPARPVMRDGAMTRRRRR